MRNLTKTLTAISLLAPVSAYPLGIGDIKLHSALNQKLKAEIALIVSADESVADLRVKLASPEKFDEAGVPWSYFLSKIKFKAVMNADGTASVNLTSQEVLREPFLDFLIEVSWPKGNLYREFTVLVDPPVAYTQPIIPVIQQAKQVNTATVKSNSYSSVQSAIEKRQSSDQYEYTRRADSLWKVADRTNPHSDVSIEQMMMAIFEANPSAFYKNNVNALKAGQRLNIPGKNAILKLSKKAALSAFRRQNKVWKGKVAAKKLTQQTNLNSINDVSSQLELEAPVEAEIAEKVVVVTDTDATVDAISSPLDSEKPGIESSGASQALHARMEKLEKQLMMMQKMLVLKDEQIAALQNQPKTTSEISATSKNQSEPIGVAKGVLPSTVAEKIVSPIESKLPTPVKTTPAVKPKLVKKLKTITPAAEPETDIVTWILGGVGAIILAILGLIFWRRRKIEEEIETESMFATASEISLPDSALDQLGTSGLTDSSSYDVGTVGESSFLSEFTPSDFDAFDTDQNEVDPISEADVYLAYGRYQQAEDLMRQAIEEQPDRDECKIKLLEIFYANENKDAFKTYVDELVSAGKQNDSAFWSKVSEMGSELDPESTLYGEKASFADVGLESEAVATVLNSDDNEESVSLDSTDTAIADVEPQKDNIETEMDFDMSIFDQDDDTSSDSEETIVKANDDENSLDFDLSAFEDNTTNENNLVEESNEEPESIEFDFDTTEIAEDISDNKASLVDSEIESLEFGEEVDLESTESNIDEINSSSKNESLDKSDDNSLDDAIEEFEFDFDMGAEDVAPSIANSLDDIDLNVSDLTDTDELETKIDLAKAYIDMGDPEAAKNIAEEVLEKGTDEQKNTAQEIINQLK